MLLLGGQEVAEEKAHQWARDYLARLTERTSSRLIELASHARGSNGSITANGAAGNGALRPAIGEPTVNQYVAFDVVATSPIQFTGILFVPPAPAGWRHELPNRYLVYRK